MAMESAHSWRLLIYREVESRAALKLLTDEYDLLPLSLSLFSINSK